MDGWILIAGQIDRQMDGRLTDVQMDRQIINEQIDRLTDGKTDRWIDG